MIYDDTGNTALSPSSSSSSQFSKVIQKQGPWGATILTRKKLKITTKVRASGSIGETRLARFLWQILFKANLENIGKVPRYWLVNRHPYNGFEL